MTPAQFDNIMLNKTIHRGVLTALRAYDPAPTTDANETFTVSFAEFKSANGKVIAAGDLIFKVLSADIDNNRGFKGFVLTVDDAAGGDAPIGLIVSRFSAPDNVLVFAHASATTVGPKKTFVTYAGRSFVYNYPTTV